MQEEKIFAGKVLKIHICTMDGTEWLEEVTEDTTVEKLKERCLKHVGFSWLVCVCPASFFFRPVTPLPGVLYTVPCPFRKLSVSVSLALYL